MLRDQEAYELYQTGLTYQEVGEKMGTSRLAYDGSGTVLRGRDAGLKPYSVCCR